MKQSAQRSPRDRALDLDKNITVTAGAGTGKTSILVKRFLKIVLQQPFLTGRVVAITFTEKAAGEMQERVATDVNKCLQEPGLKENDRRSLQFIRDQLSSVYISTIHGFCTRILREFPVEAGVSPDFGILDPIRQQVLLSQAVRNSFKWLDENASSEPQKWQDLFLGIPRFRIVAMLQAALERPYETRKINHIFTSRSRDAFMEFLQRAWMDIFSTLATDEDMATAVRSCGRIIQNNKTDVQSTAAENFWQACHLYQESFNRNTRSMDTCGLFLQLGDLFTTSKNTAYTTLSKLGTQKCWSREVHNDLLDLSKQMATVMVRLKERDPGNPPDIIDEKWYDLFLHFIDLYEMVSKEYRRLKDDQAVLDFEDLQIFTNDLLQNNADVRHVLQNRFRYIMVDEFQDTNPIQWDIVSQLAREAGKWENGKVFVVGDPKQSIYGFRDADIRIFNQVIRLYCNNAGFMFADLYDGYVVFGETFRFLPGLNDFINFLFSNILKSDSSNPFEVGYTNLEASRQLTGHDGVELAFLDEKDTQHNEEEYIAERIKQIVESETFIYEFREGQEIARPVTYGDIAILLRDRNNLNEVEIALRRKGIPFKTVGGIGFWQRQETYDIYYLLRFLSNPTDDLALVALLRSRLFMLADTVVYALSRQKGYSFLEKLRSPFEHPSLTEHERHALSDVADKIDTWLNYREHMPLGELLTTIIDETCLLTVLNAEFSGEQRTANLQKVVELADAFDLSGPGGLQAFLDTIDDLINREVAEGEAFLALDDKASVKIMTIHVSKGLQFPVVFVPFLNRGKRSFGNDVLFDTDLGMAISFRGEDENRRGQSERDSTLFRLLNLKQRQKELAEQKRIFYVAVTRASNYLYLSTTIKTRSNTAAKSARDSMSYWLEEVLFGKGINPSEAGVYSGKKFKLNIVTGYEKSVPDDDGFTRFSSQVVQIENILNNPPAVTEPDKIIAKPLTIESSGRIFSATSLMVFERNKEEYFQRYHLGFFKDDYETFARAAKSPSDPDQSRDVSLLKGKIVHRYLELFSRTDNNRETLLERILFENEVFDDDLRTKMEKEVGDLLYSFTASEKFTSIKNIRNYQNEISITMAMGEDYFTGTIDRLQQDDNGEWLVVDYKTNRIRASQLEEMAREYDIQIKSYALLISRLYPQQQKYRVQFYFLAADAILEKEFSPTEVNAIENEFVTLIKKIKIAFPVKPF